jgi:hypothetical protein
MSEQNFFQYEDVHVTNARFVNGGQTYAMSNVTSVKSFEEKPSRFWGIIFLLLGLILIAAQPVVGVLIAAAAGFFLYKQKTTYHVMLATSGGEVSALKTHQREYLEKVVTALNHAIIARG